MAVRFFLLDGETVPHAQPVFRTLLLHLIECKSGAAGGAFAHCCCQCFEIVAVDGPEKVELLWFELFVCFGGETQLFESFFIAATAEQKVSEIPARVRVRRRQRY